VGDFGAEELFGRIDRAFGGIPAGDPVPPVRATEPPQLGERRITLRRPTPTAYLRVAYRAPAGKHTDTAALLVADAVLSGGKGMGLGGGGPMGRSARLYRALVASGLARSASSDFDLYVDPFLFSIGATALPGTAPERIEAAVDAEVARLATEPVPDHELARAMKQVRAQYVYSGEGVTNQAFWLGQMEIVDSYRRAETFVAELAAVTPEDIRRVARTYLTPAARTIGWLIPAGDGGGSATDVLAAAMPFRRWSIGGAPAPGPTESAARTGRAPFERTELDNGIVILGQARPDAPTVVVRMRFEAGSANDPEGREGLAAFTARMLARGQEGRTFEQFNEATDDLGASLGVEANRTFVELGLRCLREDLPAMLDLAADVLRRPSFPEDEIAKVRNELMTGIREAENDTRSAADLAMRRLLYPVGHPSARRTIGTAESVAAIGRDDLVAFHRDRFGPKVLTVAIVGGVADLAEAAGLIGARFGDWTAHAEPPTPPPPAVRPVEPAQVRVLIPAKSQADLAIGFPVPERSHPDHYALDTANLILGRLGLMGRLGANVRDSQGLAYYAYSQVESGREGGVWVGKAGVDPKDIERALAGIEAEVQRLRDEPVAEDELADAKSYSTGVLPLALESNDGVAATLLALERFDLGLDYLDRYPAIINALTREDLRAAAVAHLDPERLVVGVAMPPEESEG
ncbi:MAG: hypothetical protein AVDCRST_MAG73-1300, partial [uncultured Thermomicrobiales bacterium]